MKWIDLRSDTVTQPTEKMRQAMANAEVGDDVYGEDPTVNRLQAMSAERLGKEAGLFVASGTMGNLIAVLTHYGRGDEAIMGDCAHTFVYEGGGTAALGGVHPHTIPNQPDGTLLLEDIQHAVRGDDPHFPRSRLLILENTQNKCGGLAIPREYMLGAAAVARENNLAVHLDGARVFNAAVDQGVPVVDLVDMVDTVTFCLSKGLLRPGGVGIVRLEGFHRRSSPHPQTVGRWNAPGWDFGRGGHRRAG